MNQDNKPDNKTLNSMGKPPRARKKGPENQAQEYINEQDNTAVATTAERGSQPKVKPQ